MDIPLAVIRVKVDTIYPRHTLSFTTCNKAYQNHWYGLFIDYGEWTRSTFYNNLFTTRDEAETAFEEIKKDFIANHKNRLRKDLTDKLSQLDREKSRILSVLSMKIMRK